MQILRSADKPHGSHAVAARAKRLGRGVDNRGVIGKPKIIVGAEIDDSALRDRNLARLRTQQQPLALVQAGGPDVGKLPFNKRPDRLVGHIYQGWSTTLPHWPLATRSNPSAKRASGRMCVTTGLMSSPALKRPARRYQV